MDLFKQTYTDKHIEVYINETTSVKRIEFYNAFFELSKNDNFYIFQDQKGNQWIYAEKDYMINFRPIEIGTYYYMDGKSVTRVATPEEVFMKAEEYFLPYILTDQIIVDLREEDLYYNLN